IDTSYATPFRGQDGADLLQPNVPAIKHAIDQAERSAAHPELRAKIEVLNGSGTAGLGQKAADYLTAQGFNVVRIAAAERSDYRSSLVQVLTEDKGAAQGYRVAVGPRAVVDQQDALGDGARNVAARRALDLLQGDVALGLVLEPVDEAHQVDLVHQAKTGQSTSASIIPPSGQPSADD